MTHRIVIFAVTAIAILSLVMNMILIVKTGASHPELVSIARDCAIGFIGFLSAVSQPGKKISEKSENTVDKLDQ